MWGRVASCVVYPVNYYDSWVPCFPSTLYQFCPDIFCIKLSDDLFVSWIYQGIVFVVLHCLHESIIYCYRDVEIFHNSRGFFHVDKIKDVWMCVMKNPHVCTSASSALFDNVC